MGSSVYFPNDKSLAFVRVVGILLAAGRSERFGGDKLIAPLPRSIDDIAAGTPLGVAACRHLVAALAETLAVVRPGDRVLAGMLRDEGARIVECANADEGMGASLACAVRSAADAGGWVVALADMPSIKPATILNVARALREGSDIVAPIHNVTRGHPVGFARRHCAALSALVRDEGARSIIVANRATLVLQPTDDAGVVHDVDTPAQF
ncbi:MAG TPA: nucleotidyltransferase family protein [Casimicrobiaceae bacterium]|jgi:molybdenum cofactor cytidylyltransferase